MRFYDDRLHRVFLIAILVLSLCSGLLCSPLSARASGILVGLSVTPGTAGDANQYDITADFASLPAGSTISVWFDQNAGIRGYNTQTSVPANVTSLYAITIYSTSQTTGTTTTSYPSAISVLGSGGNGIQFTLSQNVMSPLRFVIGTACGISPLTTGSHDVGVQVSGPSVVTDDRSGTYTINRSSSSTAPISLTNVTLGSAIPGQASSYRFDFNVAANYGLTTGDTISIAFPTGFSIPTYLPGSVFGLAQYGKQISDFSGTAVQVTGNVVTVTLPTTSYVFDYSSLVSFYIGQSAQIDLPAHGGSFTFEIWTSRQTNHATQTVTLGSSITNLQVSALPLVAGARAQYSFSFQTSTAGALPVGSGSISIAWPTGFTLPASVSAGTVTVNGSIANCTISGQTLTIRVPVAIVASSPVNVAIGIDGGFANGPFRSDGYQLQVSTSVDQNAVSASLVPSVSTLQSVQTSVVPAVKGATAAYTVSFTTGAGGTLKAGDSISLFLPYGFTVPSTMTASQVLIKSPATAASGINPASVTCSPSAQSVVLTLPSAASIAGGATVAIGLPAVITNPAAGGSFTVKVSTSRETTAVESQPFTIYNNPVSTLKVTPASPDGRNGIYLTQPSFTISVDGPSGVTLTAFYKIDNAASFTSYTIASAPSVALPAGTHTLSYYAQDSLGNIEPTHTQQFTVDLTDPAITVSSPAEKAVVVQATTTVTGKVTCLDPSSVQLTVGGQPVAVAADGSFSTPVTFSHEGDNTVTLTATSASGRTKSTTLTVDYIARVTMSLVIGSTTINMNNEFKTIEAAPYISRKGVTMVPLRFISEAFRAAVAWDPVFKAVTIDLNGKTMRIQVGYLSADVNGKSFALQDAPAIVKGRTFVPLRFIAENFGARVDWNAALKTVNIVYPKP